MDVDLARKLRWEKCPRRLVLNLPEGVDVLAGHDSDTVVRQPPYDLILAFTATLEEMSAAIRKVDRECLLAEGKTLYLVYPKLKNPRGMAPIHRDAIFPFLRVEEQTGIVSGTAFRFNAMFRLDDSYTVVGLKLDGNGKPRREGPSQLADDYLEAIEPLRQLLTDAPDALAAYDALPQGYRKSWARSVFSAQTEATRERRAEEMKTIIRAGYKSKELYQQDKRKKHKKVD